MVLLAWLLGIAIAIVMIAIFVVFLNRFYRKSTRDVALARTGFGGQKIVLSGGCLALPFLHKVDEINMRTNRMEVKRTGEKSLITADRILIDLEAEFVIPAFNNRPTCHPERSEGSAFRYFRRRQEQILRLVAPQNDISK